MGDDLDKKVDDLGKLIDRLSIDVNFLNKKVDDICVNKSTDNAEADTGARGLGLDPGFQHVHHQQQWPMSPLGPESISPSEVEREFLQIKDSLNKITLPNECKVFDGKQGIARENQGTLTVISKCARYTESALKQMSVLKVNDQDINIQKLYSILFAQINFLQSEYAALLVKSKFDSDTSNLFKCLEKNSSALAGKSLDNLKVAAEITAAKQRFDTSQTRPYFGRGNFRGRGSGRGFFPRRGYRQYDNFDGFTNYQRPYQRYPNTGNHDQDN